MRRSYLLLVTVAGAILLLGISRRALSEGRAALVQSAPAAAPPEQSDSPHYLSLAYEIDRSAVPALTYQALSLRIFIGPVASLHVAATSASGEPAPVTYDHDPVAGSVTVTTAGAHLYLLLEDPQMPEGAGSFEKTALKDDARWAWSHSFDDNVDLAAPIDVLREHGYRATLYLIAENVEDARDQAWIVDAPAIHRLMGEGWSIGNHTWDHTCDTAQISAQTILSGYNRLSEVIATSPVPDYRLIAFAAPCFKAAYHPLIQQMVADGATDVQFNESGGKDLMVVDPGAVDYTADGRMASAFTYTMPVGRDPSLQVNDGLAEAVATADWVAGHATAGRHLWYNTFTHGNHAADLEALASHIDDNYGAGGSGEVWVAPADEIYSYLLVRDRSAVSFSATELVPVATNKFHVLGAGADLLLRWPPPESTAPWIELTDSSVPFPGPGEATRLAIVPSATGHYTVSGALNDLTSSYYRAHLLAPAGTIEPTTQAVVGEFTFLLQTAP